MWQLRKAVAYVLAASMYLPTSNRCMAGRTEEGSLALESSFSFFPLSFFFSSYMLLHVVGNITSHQY